MNLLYPFLINIEMLIYGLVDESQEKQVEPHIDREESLDKALSINKKISKEELAQRIYESVVDSINELKHETVLNAVNSDRIIIDDNVCDEFSELCEELGIDKKIPV